MTGKRRFLDRFPKAIADDSAALFVGAGMSMDAGYPSWKKLLKDIGTDLGVSSDDVGDLSALAQWGISKARSRTRVLQVIRDEVGGELPIPDTLRVLSRLPIRNIWTTNYDTLIERAFSELGRPLDTISNADDLTIKRRAGATRLLKMHGSVSDLSNVVIATSDYELYKKKRGAFINILNSHLTTYSLLFLGLSFTDPNIKHVLSQIVESFDGSPPEHFAIVKPPTRDEYRTDEEFSSKKAQHDLWAEDLLRYGLVVVEIDDYDEIFELLSEVERRVKANKVWVSGSWPLVGASDDQGRLVYEVADRLGVGLATASGSLVTGAGTTVGSGVLAGFLRGLGTGAWEIDRRIVALPFPQPNPGAEPDRAQWAKLREQMAALSGSVVFVGGLKLVDGKPAPADGVFAEFDAAVSAGLYVIPIGSTGGAAAQIASRLIGSEHPSSGPNALRPTDRDLAYLSETTDVGSLVERVISLLTARF